MYSLFANNPSQKYIEEHLDGNLCRCTGYRPIWDAAKSLCQDDDDGITRGPCGVACRECPEREVCDMECNVEDKKNAAEEKKDDSVCCSSSSDKMKFFQESYLKDPKAWLDQPNSMFPEELKTPLSSPLMVVDKSFHAAGTWFKPTTLKDLLLILNQFKGECKIVIGNTEVGIETKFKHSVFPRLVSPSTSITSIFSIESGEKSLKIGSCTPLSTIQHYCSETMGGSSDFSRIAKPIHDMLRWFASTQIRNVACLGGNLATASPISDMNPMLASMGATLIIASCDENGVISRRNVKVSEFFLSYRTVDLQPHEFIEGIEIPKPDKVFEYIVPFKQARRREDDISIVTSGMRLKLAPNETSYEITDCSIAFGGLAPKTIMANETQAYLIGKSLALETFVEARKVLLKEIRLPSDVPGGQAQYRMTLAGSFLQTMFYKVTDLLDEDLKTTAEGKVLSSQFSNLPSPPSVNEDEKSAAETFVEQEKPSISGEQKFPPPKSYNGLESKKYDIFNEKKSVTKKVNGKDVVGQPATHASGALHCTGEAVYTDDIPLPPNSLHATLITAAICNAEFLSIDTKLALETPGVHAIYTHEDIEQLGGNNKWGAIQHDEYIFLPIGATISTVGQVVGVCVADSLEASEAGARATKIEYGDVKETPIVSIEDAINANSFYEFSRHVLEKSSPLATSEEDELVEVEGSFRCGGQEHFYLETNSTLAVPSDGGRDLTVYCSTQAVTKTQKYCASVTNMPASRVVVRMVSNLKET